MAITEILKKSEFFQGLKENQLERISALCRSVSFREGAIVFAQGDEARELYLLTEGKVALELAVQPDPKRSVIPTAVEVVTQGEAFGWSALVEPYRYTLSARCMTSCSALSIKGEVFREVMAQDPTLGFNVMKALARLIAGRLDSTRARLTSGLGLALQSRELHG